MSRTRQSSRVAPPSPLLTRAIEEEKRAIEETQGAFQHSSDVARELFERQIGAGWHLAPIEELRARQRAADEALREANEREERASRMVALLGAGAVGECSA